MISTFFVWLSFLVFFALLLGATYAVFLYSKEEYNKYIDNGRNDIFDAAYTAFLFCFLVLGDLMVLAGIFKVMGL